LSIIIFDRHHLLLFGPFNAKNAVRFLQLALKLQACGLARAAESLLQGSR
jgi:hypothetical protein